VVKKPQKRRETGVKTVNRNSSSCKRINAGFGVKPFRHSFSVGGGFTILEMVVAIFLIAIILGTVLLLMAANLNILDKANNIMIANALAQYTIEDVKNIDFPPVYCDRQNRFGDRPLDGLNYKSEAAIVPVIDGGDWTPEEFQEKYSIRRYDFRYDTLGAFLDGSIPNDTDITMQHRVDVYILRRNDDSVILKNSITISRDGLF